MSDMKSKNCQAPCVECDIEPFTRNYYFTGKLLVERDFKQEQEYYVDKFRHHDQTLHGWGVVCGLKVQAHQNPQCRNRFVCIEPGTAIDCCGHEILVHDEDCIDITQLPAIKGLAAKQDAASHTLQVCIRYRECPTEQIPVLYDDCGCNETQCAPNRILESYDIDVIVDPKTQSQSPTTPSLQWTSTINVAHSQAVALNESTHRLYVLTSDNPAAIYEVSTDNFSIVASHSLTAAEGAAQAIAASNDGTQLFVALSNGNLLVLNTADFSEAATTAIPGAGAGIKVDFAVAPDPDNRLLTLVEPAGTVLVWPSPLANDAPPAVTINLNSASTGIAPSSNAALTYSVGTNAGANTNQNVEVGTIATAAAASTAVLPADAVPTAIAVASSSSGDQLAVVDQKNRLFLVAMTTPPALIGTAPLTNPGVSVVASPDGLWAYVLEQDAAGNDSVEAIDLGDLRQNLPLVPGTPLLVGADSQQVVLTQSGQTLYVPYIGVAGNPTDGGVAILTVSETACCSLFWKSLDGCPSCDTADCIVLATIENYELGFFIQDQTDPPADPAQDEQQKFARINNRTRQLLPSTSTIAEVVQCLCESKGSKGPKGDPGTPGQNGLGLNPGLPKIIDIGWTHKQSIPWETFELFIEGYQLTGGSLLPQIQQHFADNTPPLLTIYFNQPTLSGIDRQTLTVTIEYPSFYNPFDKNLVWSNGLYAAPLKLYGFPTPIPGPLPTPHTGETAQSAVAFVIDPHFLAYVAYQNNALLNAMFEGATKVDPALDLPCVSVRLKGDFIYAANAFSDGVMLDADNIGGQVGINETRGGPITGGKNPSGDMVEGGDFESWFFLQAPIATGTGTGDLIQLNSATADNLSNAPGVTATLAKKIVAERAANGPFTSLTNLAERLKLSEKTIHALRGHVTTK
jgi:DNA uptake protein ComE-like DNA-binding protein